MTSQTPSGEVADRGPQMIAIYWAEAAIAVVVVALRIWGRITLRQVGIDDYVMVFTLILFIVLAGLSTYYAKIGGLRHLYDLTPQQQTRAVEINWITQPWVIFGFASGKISVALLILRIIGPKAFWRSWTLYFCIVTVFVLNTVDCIITFTQCSPPKALWTPSLVTEGKAKCWNPHVQSDYAIFLSCWNVMVDVILAVLPVTIFYRLSITIEKKLGLSVLLGLGLVAAVCGAIKTKFLASLSARSDLTWETYNLFVWSSAELFVIIVCGSVPPIKPLYDMIFHQNRMRTGYGSTAGTQNNYVEEHSLKSSSSGWPLGGNGDRNPNPMTDSDEERGMGGMGAGAGDDGTYMPGVGGITKITSFRITHNRPESLR